MFCIKICSLEPELVEPSFYRGNRCKKFLPGAGAQKKYLEPEPRKNVSAPQHCFL